MHTTTTKEAFKQEIKGRIREIDAQIELINSRIEQMDAENKIMFQNEFDLLRAEKERMKNDLAIIEQSDESTWEKMKGETEDKWNQFKAKLEKFYHKL